MKINSINTLLKYMLEDPKFHLYRGQRESLWPLESTMTRALCTNPAIKSFGASAEEFSISRFRKSAHLYDTDFNHFKDCDFSVLTYIQHHGSPTRLLDFTSSKFIALFFAFDNIDLSSGGKYVRIWQYDYLELGKITNKLIGVDKSTRLHDKPEETWKKFIYDNKHNALFTMHPTIDSMRSHTQNGVFLCAGNIQKSINDTYKESYSKVISYVDINKNLYEKVYNLLRKVNISHSTLYGGIDSFSKDIKNRILSAK